MQFIYRLSFGLAAAMAVTSPRLVTSGYFRNHLYVTLGMNVLAAMVAISAPAQFSLWPAVAAALLSYIGSAAWLYESPRLGRLCLVLVAGVTLYGAWSSPWKTEAEAAATSLTKALAALDVPTGGLALGVTIAAMFLGHWYLNTPTMQLQPLQRLVWLMSLAIAARGVVCLAGLAWTWQTVGPPDATQWSFLAMRWLSGLVGALVLARMTWQTLRIPNTQSATGILYVAVIGTFLGELTSLLLSRGSPVAL
ncbi:MAG: hypothetical protein AB7O62_11225 [Pirellulales bacterium]